MSIRGKVNWPHIFAQSHRILLYDTSYEQFQHPEEIKAFRSEVQAYSDVVSQVTLWAMPLKWWPVILATLEKCDILLEIWNGGSGPQTASRAARYQQADLMRPAVGNLASYGVTDECNNGNS